MRVRDKFQMETRLSGPFPRAGMVDSFNPQLGTLMMRIASLVALISLAVLLPPQAARTQTIAFGQDEIVKLAQAIVAESSHTYQLPSSYQMTMTNGHTMILTAPNAFELLCRAVISWQQTKAFPTEATIELLDLKGPEPEPKYEPSQPGAILAMPSDDVGYYAVFWLKSSAAPGHNMYGRFTYQTSYSQTPAQFIMAMAVLIDKSIKEKKVPESITMPQIRSPQNWQATDQPVDVDKYSATAPAPEIKVEVSHNVELQMALNGIAVAEFGPSVPNVKGSLSPFCGTIHIDISGSGPVDSIRLLLDRQPLDTYQGVGPYTYDLDTLPIPDGLHMLSAIATNDEGKTFATIVSFSVQNGRKSGFTPAILQMEKKQQ